MASKKSKRRREKTEQAANGVRTVARNRRASYDYDLLERYEAGLALTGTEIKSLRQGKGSIAEAYVRPQRGELWLVGATIARYEAGNRFNHEPTRDRKLLLHRRQISELTEAFEERGLTLVPLHLYIARRGLAKLEIGIGRGRKRHDKRRQLSRRDADRQIRQALRRRPNAVH